MQRDGPSAIRAISSQPSAFSNIKKLMADLINAPHPSDSIVDLTLSATECAQVLEADPHVFQGVSRVVLLGDVPFRADGVSGLE